MEQVVCHEPLKFKEPACGLIIQHNPIRFKASKFLQILMRSVLDEIPLVRKQFRPGQKVGDDRCMNEEKSTRLREDMDT